MKNLHKEEILGISITSNPASNILQYISECIISNQKLFISTPNPEMIILSKNDSEFAKILNKSDIATPDGRGIVWASNVLDRKIDRTITGVDTMLALCTLASQNHWSVFLFGAKKGVAEIVKKELENKYPNINVLGAMDGSPDENDDQQILEQIKERVRAQHIDLFFVAYGAPKQEKWIWRNKEKVDATVFMGVGGAFDYISNKITRAPMAIRNIGLEWLYRLLKEPWRWKRQLKLIKFVWLIFASKNSKKN